MNPSIGKSALILASGDDVPLEFPHHLYHNDLVICADGGAVWARSWNITPHIIVGDLDSLDGATQEYWEDKEVPFQRVSAVKDQTDLELAVEYALCQDVTKITVVGGWGSRIDHSLGNLELLYSLALKGIENLLITKEHVLSAFCREFRAEVKVGSVVSLIPLSTEVLDVSTKGLLYPLQGAKLEKGNTFTVSNVAVEEYIAVMTGQGVLLAVVQQ